MELNHILNVIWLRQHVLSQINVLMEKSINSDDTMAASEMFDIILSQIQRSSLNFRLQVSPYSAVISLKKSLVKDKFGTLILKSSFKNESGVYPCSESSEAKFKIQTLEA